MTAKKFRIGQAVIVNKPGHARHGQTGRVLHHADYESNTEWAAEVVTFQMIQAGHAPRYIAGTFGMSELEKAGER